jgi:hypothetical protein
MRPTEYAKVMKISRIYEYNMLLRRMCRVGAGCLYQVSTRTAQGGSMVCVKFMEEQGVGMGWPLMKPKQIMYRPLITKLWIAGKEGGG